MPEYLVELIQVLGILPCSNADAQMHKSLCIVHSCRSHPPSWHCAVKDEDMKGHTESNSFYHHQLEAVLNSENIMSYCLHMAALKTA
jgi:hypothetical protein